MLKHCHSIKLKKGKDCECTICGARLVSTRKLFDHLKREHYGRDYTELEPVFKKQKLAFVPMNRLDSVQLMDNQQSL